MAKTKSIIDFINCVFMQKTPWEDLSEQDKKAFSPFMMHRWISMSPDYLELMNYLQQYTTGILQPREIYKVFCGVLPKRKFWSKYIKSKKEKDTKISPALVQFLAINEHWSKDEAYDNLLTIGVDTKEGSAMLNEYLACYGIPEKDRIKKYKIKLK